MWSFFYMSLFSLRFVDVDTRHSLLGLPSFFWSPTQLLFLTLAGVFKYSVWLFKSLQLIVDVISVDKSIWFPLFALPSLLFSVLSAGVHQAFLFAYLSLYRKWIDLSRYWKYSIFTFVKKEERKKAPVTVRDITWFSESWLPGFTDVSLHHPGASFLDITGFFLYRVSPGRSSTGDRLPYFTQKLSFPLARFVGNPKVAYTHKNSFFSTVYFFTKQ